MDPNLEKYPLSNQAFWILQGKPRGFIYTAIMELVSSPKPLVGMVFWSPKSPYWAVYMDPLGKPLLPLLSFGRSPPSPPAPLPFHEKASAEGKARFAEATATWEGLPAKCRLSARMLSVAAASAKREV